MALRYAPLREPQRPAVLLRLKEWRCDTHPSASRSGRQFCFDSAHAGGRQVYVADIAGLLG